MPELLNSCLLLYAWRVGFNYKIIFNLSSTVISSSSALEDLDRMIGTNDGRQVCVFECVWGCVCAAGACTARAGLNSQDG